MTDQLCRRTHHVDLSIRQEEDGSGRTVFGVCVPFDTPVRIRDWEGDYEETFKRGAFAKTISERGERVKLLYGHNRWGLPIGRATLLREDPTGLYGEFHVASVSQGDEILQLIRDGALDSLSIGFRPVKTEWNDDKDTALRLEVRLDEVSVVPFAAYDDAVVEGIRALHPSIVDLDRGTMAGSHSAAHSQKPGTEPENMTKLRRRLRLALSSTQEPQ